MISTKRSIVILTIVISTLLSACSTHQHQYLDATCNNPAICSVCNAPTGEALGHTSDIGVCHRCGKIGNEELLVAINADFEQMMEAGTSLFSCLSGISDLDASAQYEKFLEADQYTATMAGIYEKIVAVCADLEELDTIVYQTKLLKNACPPAIFGSDATSLANQGVLYQLYLQQLSSSCSYISECLDYLAGNRVRPEAITYFEEVPEMPTPDAILYGISYHSTQTAPGNIQYMYLLGDSETDAMLNYNLFLSAIGANLEMEVDISDSMAILYQNGNMISVMMAGNDSSIGYFLAISFQSQ